MPAPRPGHRELDDPEASRMSLGAHLDELRARLILVLLGLVATFVVSWVFSDRLMALVVRPHRMTMRALGLPETLRLLRYPEGFYASLKLAFLGAVVLSSPLIFFQAWAYVRGALYRRERKPVLTYGAASLALFAAGVVFGFLVLIPLGLRFLAQVASGVAEPMIGLDDYLSLVITLTLVTGLVFELPLVMRFVARLGLVEAKTFRQKRGPAVLAAFIVAAVLTPPDCFTQILLAVPMVALYEVGICFCEPSVRNLARPAGIVVLGAAVLGGFLGYNEWRDRRAVTLGASGEFVAVGADFHGEVDGETLRAEGGATLLARRGAVVRVVSRRVLRLVQGEALADAPAGASLRILTPDVQATLSGARAHFRVGDGATEVTGVRGEVGIVFEGGESRVLAGRRRRFAAGGEPVPPESILPWTK